MEINPFAPKVVGTIYEKTCNQSGIATEGHEKPVSITAGNEVYIKSIIASSRRRTKLSRQSPINTIERIKGIINTKVLSIELRTGMPNNGIIMPKIMSKITVEIPN